MKLQYRTSMTRGFWQQVSQLDVPVWKKWQRVGLQLAEDPFHVSLSSELLSVPQPNVYSARLDDNYRIIFRYIKPDTILLYWLDTHDAAYAKARRLDVTLDDGVIKVVETVEQQVETVKHTYRYDRPAIGKLFERWTDKELLQMGIPENTVVQIRPLNDLDEFGLLESQLPEACFTQLFNLLLESESSDSTAAEADAVVQSTLLEEQFLSAELERELHTALNHSTTREQIHVFETPGELRTALAGTLAEWMLFLHPDQRQLVEMTANGPARITGGAGSGKTVVALHRTRYLAQVAAPLLNEKILFLTYGNRLPVIVQQLLNRLCSGTNESARIEVKTLHQWCWSYLARQCNAAPQKAEEWEIRAALNQAMNTIRRRHPRSKLWMLPPDFISDEIRYVIKGRAIATIDEYLALKRTGRGTPLSMDDRRLVFDILQLYQENISPRCDWDDFILDTLSFLDQGIEPQPYAAVVVDEVQDFSAAAMRVIKRVAGDGTNQLLLVGDNRQRIYKGGFSFKDVGISVVGRSRILRRNYRNTRQILEAAYSMLRFLTPDVGDDDDDALSIPSLPDRTGPLPSVCHFKSRTAEVAWTVSHIQEQLSSGRYKPGDIAILYRNNQPYPQLLTTALREAQLRSVDVNRSNAGAFFNEDRIKCCTFHSAKGLEFKLVYLLGLEDGIMPSIPRIPRDLQEEAIQRERRLLFVAMTRARDELYLTYTGEARSRFLTEIEPNLLATAATA